MTPWPGSPMEIVFILVWKMRQSIEFQKSRVMAQCLMAQKDSEEKAIKEVFDDLREAFFPFDKNEKAADTKKFHDRLMAEVAKGPLAVTPMDTGLTRPKIRSRLEQGQKEMARKLSMEKSGQVVEIDAVQKARRRPRSAF